MAKKCKKNFVPSLLTPKKSEGEGLEFPEFILGACSHVTTDVNQVTLIDVKILSSHLSGSLPRGCQVFSFFSGYFALFWGYFSFLVLFVVTLALFWNVSWRTVFSCFYADFQSDISMAKLDVFPV